jgi:hypothetical protein
MHFFLISITNMSTEKTINFPQFDMDDCKDFKGRSRLSIIITGGTYVYKYIRKNGTFTTTPDVGEIEKAMEDDGIRKLY